MKQVVKEAEAAKARGETKEAHSDSKVRHLFNWRDQQETANRAVYSTGDHLSQSGPSAGLCYRIE